MFVVCFIIECVKPGTFSLFRTKTPEKEYRLKDDETAVDTILIQEEKRQRRIPSRVQREVWRRDQGRCVECGSRKNIEYDHIIPFSDGGSNTARNIELLCEECNRKKSNNIG